MILTHEKLVDILNRKRLWNENIAHIISGLLCLWLLHQCQSTINFSNRLNWSKILTFLAQDQDFTLRTVVVLIKSGKGRLGVQLVFYAKPALKLYQDKAPSHVNRCHKQRMLVCETAIKITQSYSIRWPVINYKQYEIF